MSHPHRDTRASSSDTPEVPQASSSASARPLDVTRQQAGNPQKARNPEYTWPLKDRSKEDRSKAAKEGNLTRQAHPDWNSDAARKKRSDAVKEGHKKRDTAASVNKRMETMGSAGLSAAAKKRMETMGSAGLSAATQKGWKKRHADPDWDSPEADQRRSNATEHTLQLDNYVSGPANTESSSTQWEIDPTRLSQAATKGWEKRHADPDWDSPEAQQGRSDAVRQGKLKMGAQARSEAARKGKETMGPEARSEAARKAKVTRQFNKEFGDIIDLDGDQ